MDEEPAYRPEGTGDHLYLRFEKIGLDSDEVVRRVARALGVDPHQSGYAGRKDRHAITRQWMSVPCPPKDAARIEAAAQALALEGVQVLEMARHKNKLRTGHLRGNAFDLLLRDVEGDLDRVDEALAALVTRGMPAYYGEQRFGRDNLARARAWLVDGGRAPHPGDRKFLVSVLQASVFNGLCAARVTSERGLATIVHGDLARKEDTGGMFLVEDVAEAQGRADRFEISATGPMVGPEMRWPEHDAKAAELAALAAAGLDEEKLRRFGRDGQGTRRPYRVPVRPIPDAPLAERTAEGLRLRFWLPSGAYATTLVRELVDAVSTSPGA